LQPAGPLEAHADFFAAGAGSEITVQKSIGGGAPAAKLSANDPNSPKVHSLEG
jgi:hypothetical protein